MFEKPDRDKRRKRLQNRKRDQWKRQRQQARKDYGPAKAKPDSPTPDDN